MMSDVSDVCFQRVLHQLEANGIEYRLTKRRPDVKAGQIEFDVTDATDVFINVVDTDGEIITTVNENPRKRIEHAAKIAWNIAEAFDLPLHLRPQSSLEPL
jgi:hypothetical protein